MSNEPIAGPASEEFYCPVCRARQRPSTKCRRCQADLALAVKVRERLCYLRTLPPSQETQDEISALTGSGGGVRPRKTAEQS